MEVGSFRCFQFDVGVCLWKYNEVTIKHSCALSTRRAPTKAERDTRGPQRREHLQNTEIYLMVSNVRHERVRGALAVALALFLSYQYRKRRRASGDLGRVGSGLTC